MRKIIICGVLLACFISSTCGYEFKEEGLFTVIKTSKGDMGFRLFYDMTPITVGNFVGLAEGSKEFINSKSGEKEKRPFYDGLVFHRVVKGFVVQGGCPLGNGRGSPGYSFVDEFVPELKHDTIGVLSMANSGSNTNGSQFFITLAPAPHLNRRHSVFGTIVFGKDVLKDIGNVETDRRNKPLEDVVIESIRIVSVGEKAKSFDAEKEFAQNEIIQKRLDEEKEKKLKLLLKKLGVKENRIVTSKSGLRYYIKRRGKGGKPAPQDIIIAHYTGYLVDGTKFDSSYDRGRPFEVTIGVRRVIPGWDEAFLDMRKGERRVLVIPDNLAYGIRGRPPAIPPRSTLIFDVELISIKKRNKK